MFWLARLSKQLNGRAVYDCSPCKVPCDCNLTGQILIWGFDSNVFFPDRIFSVLDAVWVDYPGNDQLHASHSHLAGLPHRPKVQFVCWFISIQALRAFAYLQKKEKKTKTGVKFKEDQARHLVWLSTYFNFQVETLQNISNTSSVNCSNYPSIFFPSQVFCPVVLLAVKTFFNQ